LRAAHSQQKINNKKHRKRGKKYKDWVWVLGFLGYLGPVSHFCAELRAIFAILFAFLDARRCGLSHNLNKVAAILCQFIAN